MFFGPVRKTLSVRKNTFGQSGQKAALASLWILEINSKSSNCFFGPFSDRLNGKCLYSLDRTENTTGRKKHSSVAGRKPGISARAQKVNKVGIWVTQLLGHPIIGSIIVGPPQ